MIKCETKHYGPFADIPNSSNKVTQCCQPPFLKDQPLRTKKALFHCVSTDQVSPMYKHPCHLLQVQSSVEPTCQTPSFSSKEDLQSLRIIHYSQIPFFHFEPLRILKVKNYDLNATMKLNQYLTFLQKYEKVESIICFVHEAILISPSYISYAFSINEKKKNSENVKRPKKKIKTTKI